MPKVKRIRANALMNQAQHKPLGQTIIDDVNRDKYAGARRRNKRRKKQDNEEELTSKESQRIIDISRQQQLEMHAEDGDVNRGRRQDASVEDSDDESDNDAGTIGHDMGDDDDFLIDHDEGYVTVDDKIGMSAEDEALVASLMNPSSERRTLADMILEKIEEKERAVADDNEDEGPQLPAKVIEVYTEIGKILSRYTSGKLPKAFKVIPSLSNWEEVLYLTRPDMWTPQAMFAATRIFASNLNPKMAQRFYNLVLLDAVRADIHAHKKLNYHYFAALKKSVYKPAAFFRGILLPLATDQCTLREAAIVASVLQRVSIPSHHAAVAIHKLAQKTADYNGASSIFIRTLLNKKYALPRPVIRSLEQHFSSFLQIDDQLPVLWHQALLVFAQRYKNEVQDKEALRLVMKKHFHAKITPEIRRELFGAAAWKEERRTGDAMEL